MKSKESQLSFLLSDLPSNNYTYITILTLFILARVKIFPRGSLAGKIVISIKQIVIAIGFQIFNEKPHVQRSFQLAR